MTVPLLDLRAQFETLRGTVVPAVLDVIEHQRFILGEPVSALEEEIARRCGVAHGVGCASGTDALFLALKALDLRSGDEVITTPFTFFATAGAIVNAGGRPVFVDVDPTTLLISPAAVEAAVTDRTRAIVPVHLYGQMAAMEAFHAVATRHDVAILEDAAQAIGARRRIDGRWHEAGSLGFAGAYSFFPSKNLGGWGDGGMVVTDDAAVAERLRRLRTHGGAKQYHHDEVGVNSRLDALQAAVLRVKLPRLDQWNAARRAHAARYDAELRGIPGVTTLDTDEANEHVYHQYTIRVADRDRLKAALTEAGIGCAVYYPTPLHVQPCFADVGGGVGSCPEAERAAGEVLSLPVYPELAEEQQDRVIDAIRECCR